MTATPLLPREDFLRVLETIRANTNNPKILDATYQLELMSDSGPATHEMWASLDLTGTERRLLNHMAAHRGHTFTKAALFNALYFARQGEEPEMKTLDVFICKLRKKLVEGDAPFWIETVWSEGYKLVNTPARDGKVPAYARAVKGLQARIASQAAKKAA